MKRIEPVTPSPVTPSARDLDATHSAAAILTVHKAGDMTRQGRRRLANWLRSQADAMEAHGRDYAPRFRARYLYPKD